MKYQNELKKLMLLIYLLCLAYSISHTYFDEVGFSGFPSRFLAFIELYSSNNNININYIPMLPLFSSNVQINSSLSDTAKALLKTESYFPFMFIIHLIVHLVTNLSFQTITKFAIGAIILPIAYLAMVKKYVFPDKDHLSSSYIFFIMLGIYGTLYLTSTIYTSVFYCAPLSISLLFIIFMSIKDYYGNILKNQSFFIICLSVFCLSHYWHTMLFTSLFFIVSICLVSIFFIKLHDFKKINLDLTNYLSISNRITNLIIISMIVALISTHLWQSPYIELFLREAELSDFISSIITKLSGGITFPVPYKYNYKDLLIGKIYFSSILSIYLISMLIFIIPFCLKLKQFIQKKLITINAQIIFCLSLMLAQIIHSFSYYKSGSLNFFYVPLFFPIFGIYLLIDAFSCECKRLYKFIVAILLLLIVLSAICICSMYLSNEAGDTKTSKYNDTEGSFNWIYKYIDKEKQVIIDYNILNKYLQREAKTSMLTISYIVIDPDIYSILVGDNTTTSILIDNYAVIDHATMSSGLPVDIRGSRGYSLIPLLEQINNCKSLNKLYEDKSISIFCF